MIVMQNINEKESMAGICIVGTFPPPVHGMSVVNSEIVNNFRKQGKSIFVINHASKTFSKNKFLRILRVQRVIKGVVLAIRTMTKWKVLYIGLSGGLGQVYDLLFVFIGRVFRKRIYIHHHSFAYIDKPTIISRLIISASGVKATHIVLCERMQSMFRMIYPAVNVVRVISNVAIVKKNNDANPKEKGVKTLGYLSNICIEKGIEEFLEVAEHLKRKGIVFNALIAGPFQSDDVKKYVSNRIENLPMVKYVGPKYDDDKAEYFKAIDVLLFPTKYENEAQPLTIFEASSYGVPVIAWERGCISEMMTNGAGVLVKKDDVYSIVAVDQIMKWYNHPDEFQSASKCTLQKFRCLQERVKGELWEFLIKL